MFLFQIGEFATCKFKSDLFDSVVFKWKHFQKW
jgi:hypothetical protein